MGLESLFKSRASSPNEQFTTTRTVGDDQEKDLAMGNEYENQGPSAESVRIDAEIEKRVIRKLDKRLISLVFVLCRPLPINPPYQTNNVRSPGLPGPLKYRQRQNRWPG